MELMYAWVWFIGAPLIVVLLFLYFPKKKKYKKGTVVANTDVIEDTKLFRRMKFLYKAGRIITTICLLASIAVGFILIARPVNIDTVSPEIHNRDIMLCLDISSSVDQLNLDVVGQLKEVVKELDGERFGITIFNGKAVLLVPLTTDYEFVLDSLDHLENSIKTSLQVTGDLSLGDYLSMINKIDMDTYNYKYDGTYADRDGESSLIGDGLACALFSFPDLKTNDERSRMIIFTTDNELNGNPYVSVEEAAALCKKNDVKIFAVTPDEVLNEDSFRAAILDTGGGYYKGLKKAEFESLIRDIKSTKVSTSGLIQLKTVITDTPVKAFGWLVFLVAAYMVLCKLFRQ